MSCTCNCKNAACTCNSRLVTIIGTGTYGTALGKRLVNFGFGIQYGSRTPGKKYIHDNFRNDKDSVKMRTVEEAWCDEASKFVFFAIHAQNYEAMVAKLVAERYQRQHKIVIDVSNRIEKKKSHDEDDETVSNAECLQACFNKYTNNVTVVKAFNNVSAYSMNCQYSSKSNTSANYGNGEMVPIAGNDSNVNEQVSYLATQMGFRACQIGMLNKARKLELQNERTFPEWKSPTLFCTLFLLFNFVWYFFYSYFSNAKYKQFSDYLAKFSLLPHLNRVFAFTSIHLLAYVYLAGIVAMVYQLHYATKTKRFPRYLDLWLKSRKYLGLWAFVYASWHLLISLCILSPAHFAPWYKPATQPKFTFINETIIVNEVYKPTGFTLHGELNLLTGMIAYFIMCILAICSINSIGLSLNWSEWAFIQSKCGFVCLTASLIHDLVMYSRFVIEKDVYKYTNKHILTRVKLYCLILPTVVLLLRIIFTYFPPISRRVRDIRNGVYYEKSKKNETDCEKSKFVV